MLQRPLLLLILLWLPALVGCATSAPSITEKKPNVESNERRPLALDLIDDKDFFATQDAPGRVQPVVPEQVFALSSEAKQHFFTYIESDANARYPMHKRVFNYLAAHLSKFNYYSDTYTAQQTLDNNSGNCMSLAILTSAYANLAGLDMQYNRVDSAPVFGTEGRFEVASSHVATKLFDPTFVPQPGMLYYNRPYLLVDYFPTSNNWVGGTVSNQNFIAMFYRNLASQYMGREDFNNAGILAIEAIKHAPFDLDGINMMAVIYRHIGFDDKAEALYRYGLSLTETNLDLLYNYQLLLRAQGRTKQATQLQQRLELLDDPSPFPYLRLGDEAYAQNEYDSALRFYQKSIEKAHYLPHGYVGAAKAYYATGKLRAAKEHLKMALQHTHDSAEEQLFRAKLASLEGR